MRDDTTTDDEDAPTTEHSSRLTDADRLTLSRPRELGRYLDEERYPAEVYPTLRSEPELWLRAVEDLRIDDVFAENYTLGGSARVVVADRDGADGTHRGPEAVASEALERLAPLAACVARHHPDDWGGAPPGGVDITEDGALRIDAGELDSIEVTVPTSVMMDAVNSDEPTEAVLDAALTDLVDIEHVEYTGDSEADT